MFSKGHITSEETRRKISLALTGKKLSKEHRKKLAEKHKGKKWTEKQRIAIVAKLRFKENHQGWKGENAGYHAIHCWIKKSWGKANKCENPKCFYPKIGAKYLMEKPSRYEWANITGKYNRFDRKDWLMLCVSCHRKLDSGSHKKQLLLNRLAN